MNAIEHIIYQPEKRRHATPLLLLHGAWHSAVCWEYWLNYFPSLGYEVHAINLPGRGNSPLTKRHINAYLLGDYVNILADEISKISPTPVVIGHSIGGGILQKYIEKRRLPGAVLLAATPASGALGMMIRFALHHPVAMLKSCLTFNSYYFVDSAELVKASFFSPHTTMDIARFQKQLVREAFILGFQVAVPFAKVNPVATPMLVLAGTRDQVFTVAEQRYTARKYNSELILFEGQAHNLMLELDWRKVADTIDEWITVKLRLQ